MYPFGRNGITLLLVQVKSLWLFVREVDALRLKECNSVATFGNYLAR